MPVTERAGGRPVRDVLVRRLLIAGWLLGASAVGLSLPAYGDGSAGGADERLWLVALYALAGGVAVLALRSTLPSAAAALRASAAALLLLALAGAAAYPVNRALSDARGEPAFLYVGIALLVSWAVLVVATAVVSRARWSGIGALAVTAFVAVLGLWLAVVQLD